MADELPAMKLAAQHVTPAWTPQRERAIRERLEQRLVGRRTTRALFAVVAVVGCGVLAIGGVRHALSPATPSEAARDARPRATAVTALLSLDDGSKVTQVSQNARVTPLEVSDTATTLRLETGEALFDVTPRADRRFQVIANQMTVTVLGTAFRVGIEGSAVRVIVERGRVEAACGDDRRELSAGQQFRCEPQRPAPQNTAASQEVAATIPSAAPAPPRTRSQSSWRSLAQDGDYHGAYARMIAEGPGAVRDDPTDLLFAADVARLSGHPSDAVVRLERVLTAHAGDSRSALTAFTLGRTLLDGLGRPREAAEAFAKARQLSPNGAMAQDALAREVESWSRAGETALARERAKQYVERYPSGRRLKAVRYHAGLE